MKRQPNSNYFSEIKVFLLIIYYNYNLNVLQVSLSDMSTTKHSPQLCSLFLYLFCLFWPETQCCPFSLNRQKIGKKKNHFRLNKERVNKSISSMYSGNKDFDRNHQYIRNDLKVTNFVPCWQ